MITNSKDDYFDELGRKILNPNSGPKTYWTTLNRIINKKKKTNIPPLLENGLFFTNFQTTADIFNELFVQQCSLDQNNSALPRFISRCNTVLENIESNPSKVFKIVRSLDSNKAHGWDSLSMSMIKICDAEIVISLCLIYEKCLATEKFLEIWKKANVLPIHKKESRQIKNNYRPISLLPVCGKIFEKLIYECTMNISQITS